MNMTENSEISYGKTGYLKEEFRLFHLKDKKNILFEFHYHDFNKIIIFISGDVTYLIEGKAYKLKPWDVLLVGSNEIHKPVISPDCTYERVVIWTNDTFLDKHSNEEFNLSTCFETVEKSKRNLIHPDTKLLNKIKNNLSSLEEACMGTEPSSHILKNSIFLQLLVYINKAFTDCEKEDDESEITYDQTVHSIIDYINDNIHSDLSVGKIASKFFISKYYLMHKFKDQTGYSVHNYILQKRIMLANSLIKKGMPMVRASIESGFNDYSGFVRSFKKMFGVSPKQHYKNLIGENKANNERHF
jgi:AraC-like DNA-binding protein